MKYTEDMIFEELQKGNIKKSEALEMLKKLNNQEETSEDAKVTEEYSEDSIYEIADNIEEIVKKILHYEEGEIDRELNFKDLGFDSISGAEIVRDINEKYELGFDSSILYDYSNIDTLAEYIADVKKKNRL